MRNIYSICSADEGNSILKTKKLQNLRVQFNNRGYDSEYQNYTNNLYVHSHWTPIVSYLNMILTVFTTID